INSTKSTRNVQALEKTELLYIDKNAFDIIYKDCPVFSNAIQALVAKGYSDLFDSENFRINKSIDQLYEYLVLNKPEIIERVPMYHIATYLGVKPESLSRIKRKYKNKTSQS
ncbi:hypothetical protein N9901_03725, partial [Flavobacteriaceae bacterium]|nr:hypothetical protein [Flavobacteriaceae bacterium]